MANPLCILLSALALARALAGAVATEVGAFKLKNLSTVLLIGDTETIKHRDAIYQKSMPRFAALD